MLNQDEIKIGKKGNVTTIAETHDLSDFVILKVSYARQIFIAKSARKILPLLTIWDFLQVRFLNSVQGMSQLTLVSLYLISAFLFTCQLISDL